MKVAVVTKIPSPYQVELFDAIAESRTLELSVAYLRASDPDRKWASRPFRHRALFIDSDARSAESTLEQADLVVFSWYQDSFVRHLMRNRARSRRAWCYWGERPGFAHRGVLGRSYRRLRLWPLWHDSLIPIWGIGRWAIEGYLEEFRVRPYYYVPYVSNLTPFFQIERNASTAPKTILFSGSLIERKGISELVSAFRRVSRRHAGSRLLIVGGGPLESRLRSDCRNEPSIHFLGFQDWDSLASAYAQAEVLCAPSHYDGWGLIVAEAMAAGMPVISSTAVGCAREMVDEASTGYLTPPKDVDALEAALEAALNESPAKLARMGALCRAKAQQNDLPAGVTRFINAALHSAGKI